MVRVRSALFDDLAMSDADDFERCKRMLLDFCDWIEAEDRRLQLELRAMRRRHDREQAELLERLIKKAGGL